MQTPAQVTFHGFVPSDSLRMLVDERFARLDRSFPRIVKCHAVVDRPHHRHHSGGDSWQVRLVVEVPGEEIVVTRERDAERHQDPAVAIRDAFDAARRRLQGRTRRMQDARR